MRFLFLHECECGGFMIAVYVLYKKWEIQLKKRNSQHVKEKKEKKVNEISLHNFEVSNQRERARREKNQIEENFTIEKIKVIGLFRANHAERAR